MLASDHVLEAKEDELGDLFIFVKISSYFSVEVARVQSAKLRIALM